MNHRDYKSPYRHQPPTSKAKARTLETRALKHLNIIIMAGLVVAACISIST